MIPYVRDEVRFFPRDDDEIEMINEYGDAFLINEDLYFELKKGSNALLNLPKEIFEELINGRIIQNSRLIHDEEGNRVPLLRLDGKVNQYRKICGIINKNLPFISIISFLLGLLSLPIKHCGYSIENVSLFGFITIICLSSIIHELAHLCSGVALGIDISELGALILSKYLPIPIGYYVKPRRNYNLTSKQTNFYLAGIEANMIMFSIVILFSCFTNNPVIYSTFRLASWMEILMIISNILPTNKMDGDYALSAFFDTGKTPISKISRDLLFTKAGQEKLRNFGKGRYAATCIFASIYASKILYNLIVFLSVVVPLVLLIMELL